MLLHGVITSTGRARFIRTYSSARFSFIRNAKTEALEWRSDKGPRIPMVHTICDEAESDTSSTVNKIRLLLTLKSSCVQGIILCCKQY